MNVPPLAIYLFGAMRVLVLGEPMPRVRGRSITWLLALLVLRHGRSIDRSWLAGTLWPESDESQALHNLRDSLLHLRRALGPEAGRIQSVTRDTLTLDLKGAEVDAARFDGAIQAGDEDSLRSAVEVYAGPLLEGCAEEWVGAERSTREEACLKALETLAMMAERRNDYAEMARLLQRARAMDPIRDTVQRGLMRALEAAGDAPAALGSYRQYRLLLHEQMQVAPDEETVQLWQQIRHRAKLAAEGSPQPRARTSESSRVSHALPNALPHPITRLIGRDEQVLEVRAALSGSRLVTLVGAGGVGKTRLAIQAAEDIAAGSGPEVAFVALASLSDPALLPGFVANTLGIHEKAGMEPGTQTNAIVEWLLTREALLVMDNCEHLIDDAARFAQTLLESCPELRILATSRQRLGIMGEVVWRVPSLPVPDLKLLPSDTGEAAISVRAFAAIELFIERACAANAEFRMACRADVEAICSICARLDGAPLAIELAAARVGSLSVQDIQVRLDQRFRLLAGNTRAALPRQQTLKALIDWSYDLLSENERALLCSLSVFAGGWTLGAAEAVCAYDGGTTRREDEETHEGVSVPRTTNYELRTDDVLDLLTGLVDKSLVVAETSRSGVRYHMVETIREYSRGRLQDSGAEAAWRERHLNFFLAMAEQMDASPSGSSQSDRITSITPGSFRG